MGDENQLSEAATILGMIGAWSQDTERFLIDKHVDEKSEIVLTRAETENMLEALNRIQEGLVLSETETRIHAPRVSNRYRPSDLERRLWP